MKKSGYRILVEFTLNNNMYDYTKEITDEYSYYRMTSDLTRPDGTPMCFRLIVDKTGRMMLWYCFGYSYDPDDPELFREINRLNGCIELAKFVSKPNLNKKLCHIEASYICDLSFTSFELTDPVKMALASIQLDMTILSFMTECYNAEIMINADDDNE